MGYDWDSVFVFLFRAFFVSLSVGTQSLSRSVRTHHQSSVNSVRSCSVGSSEPPHDHDIEGSLPPDGPGASGAATGKTKLLSTAEEELQLTEECVHPEQHVTLAQVIHLLTIRRTYLVATYDLSHLRHSIPNRNRIILFWLGCGCQTAWPVSNRLAGHICHPCGRRYLLGYVPDLHAHGLSLVCL